MRVPRQLQQLTAIEILDRGARLYRANLRPFFQVVFSIVMSMGLIYYIFRLQTGRPTTWDTLLPVRADALATLLGTITSPLRPLARQIPFWTAGILYLLLQMFIVSLIVPLCAQLYLQPFTDLLPEHDNRLARTLQLLPPLVLLLPIDLLIACIANLLESLPIVAQLGSLEPTLWPMFFRLTSLRAMPLALSFVATLAVARLWCAPQAIALERCGPAAGLRRSWHLTRGQFGRVVALIVGLSILVALIGAAPISAALLVAGLTNTEELSLVLLAIATPAAKLVQVLMLPVPPIVATLLYYDLRARVEGYDLEVAARQALLDGAVAKQEQDNLQEALADYKQILQFTPNNLRLLCTLVDLKVRLGDLDGALADSERAVTFFPKNVYAWNNRGYVRMQLGDLDGALADLNRALQGAPHDSMVLTSRAHVLHRRGDYRAAQTDLLHALQFDPKSARAMYNLSCGYAKQEQPEPALDWLERAVAIDEHFREHAYSDDDFAALREHPRFAALLQAKE
jgi:Flp pilus assembly protein TadD